ncbi:MAG TPA: tetratricopeptide repeat protein [Chitinophagaceae bacterium]|nr:tetratricopeptide repeat protein [Chitinophagaceae bacterium]
MGRSSSVKVFGFLALVMTLSVLLLEYCKPGIKKDLAAQEPNDFVGDQKCQGCHAKEFDLWQQSDHFRAMMPANDTTVLGDFNDVSHTADGVSSRFFRKNGKFYINTEGPDGLNHDYEVLYTFGFKPLQQYLVAFPGGRMQVPRVSWDVNKKKWFNQYAGQKMHHNDWLHWTGGGQNWNTMCASCHSTNLQKNYMADADSFHTTFSVLTVSCESCHGPGKTHISFVESDDYKKGGKVKYSYLLPIDSPNVAQVNNCAPCHARKSDLHAVPVNSTEIMDNMIPEIPSTEFFHADGQVNDEDYIYTSFLQSKMFHRSVKCSNCHDPHSGKLVLPATLVCMQCHEKKYESFEHTRHEAKLSQVNCVSCHMPGKFYMGNDFRHDHSFRVPRPDLSVKYGTPNACNMCHTDKKAQWASDAVVKWFGPERKYHFADDLIPGSRMDGSSEAHLQRLLADTSVPDIVKATAAEYMRNIPTMTALKSLLAALGHKDAQVRYRALRSLPSFPFEQWKDAAAPMFDDKVKAVRIAAADLFLQLPAEQIPVDYRNSFSNAKQELQQYLMYQADFSVGNVMIGDFYYRLNDLAGAEKYYQRALKKDSVMNYVRFNLSSLYNAQGRNNEALKVLQDAKSTDPANPRVYYNLALLNVEMKDLKSAMENFARSISLGNEDPRVYYNYGILNQQTGNFPQAEKIFQKGISLAPGDPSLNYALAYLYVQQRQYEKALAPATTLKKTDPSNPEYQALFRQLQLN